MSNGQRARLVGIVEDDVGMREGLSWLLMAARFSVVSFASAEEFLQRALPKDVDCLVVDVRLPGMDGIALCQVMQERGRRIPTLFMSGHDDPAMHALFRRAGITRWLRKPFAGQTLIDAVHDAIGTID